MKTETKWVLWILAIYSLMLIATAYAEETETVPEVPHETRGN